MKGDRAVEASAEKLAALSDRAAAKGGVGEKVADELADDAGFVRKLKPSLIAARAKGTLPENGEPASPAPSRTGVTSASERVRKGGPNPFLVAGGAFAAGTVLAKLIDWRAHAHPRR